MSIFNPTPYFPALDDIEFKTLIDDKGSESGKEKTRNDWPTGTLNGETVYTGKRTFKIICKAAQQTQYNYISQFFQARGGRKESFDFENTNESPVSKVYPSNIIIASNYQAEDTTTLAHYPIIGNSQYIYDDGVLLVEGVDYTIVDATGVITWLIKPANSSVITGDYRFYRVVRFTHDNLPRPRLAYGVYEFELFVKEIEPRL